MIHRRWRVCIERMLVAVAFALGMSGAAELRAEMPSLFEVRGVKVDVTAETAAAAREKALIEGQRRAFRVLLDRLTLPVDRTKLPEPSRAEIDRLVRDFSVSQEKTSAVRYIATLDCRFREDAVRRLLLDHGLPFAATRSKTVLVLPVYQASGASVLWDDPNPWRQAWASVPAGGLVPMILPIGDLADVSSVDAEQAIGGDRARLGALARRYDAGDVLVALAVLGVDPRSKLPQVKISLQGLGGGIVKPTPGRTFGAASPEESVDDLLKRAAAAAIKAVEENWKRQTLLPVGPAAMAQVKAPISGLSDWVTIHQRLQKIAAVERVDLALLSRNDVWLNIIYVGTIEQLALALQQADLALKPDGGNWTLELASPLAEQKS